MQEASVRVEAQACGHRAERDRLLDAEVVGQHVANGHVATAGRHSERVGLGRGLQGSRHARGARTAPAVDAEKGAHAAVELVVRGQAQRSVEQRESSGGIEVALARRLDQRVVRLARSEQHFVLRLRVARGDVAVFSNERDAHADQRRDVGARPGVDHAQQHVATGVRAWHFQRRRLGVGLVEGQTVDQEGRGRVVDSGRIARRSGSAARVVEPLVDVGAGKRRSVDRGVLHGVDLAEQQ